jgi:hypothetical protein
VPDAGVVGLSNFMSSRLAGKSKEALREVENSGQPGNPAS